MKKAIFFLGLSVLLFSNSALAQNLPSYLPSNGLVGWWPFNGNANDESGNGNNGTVNGATLTSDRNANAGGAYSFDGINDYIEVVNDILPGDFQSMSISFWFKKNQAAIQTQAVINNRSYLTSGYKYYLNFVNYLPGSGLQSCMRNAEMNSEVCTFSTSGNQSSGFWRMGTFTLDSETGQTRLYIDGTIEGVSSFTSSSWPQSVNPTFIGGSPLAESDNQWFLGDIDDIAIYNRALTQDEITALYTGTPVNGGGGSTSTSNPVPPGIPYQAVVRNANGQVAANTAVTTRFTLHQNTADGAIEYQETHALTTNAQGLMATVMGQGTAAQNTFASINWANTTKFLQVEVDLGNGYVDLGTQQLMSVPYSIQSQTALTIRNTDLPVYADNAAALAGGLTTGQLYRTSTGDLKIVY